MNQLRAVSVELDHVETQKPGSPTKERWFMDIRYFDNNKTTMRETIPLKGNYANHQSTIQTNSNSGAHHIRASA